MCIAAPPSVGCGRQYSPVRPHGVIPAGSDAALRASGCGYQCGGGGYRGRVVVSIICCGRLVKKMAIPGQGG
jgi:hypothetical protein